MLPHPKLTRKDPELHLQSTRSELGRGSGESRGPPTPPLQPAYSPPSLPPVHRCPDAHCTAQKHRCPRIFSREVSPKNP